MIRRTVFALAGCAALAAPVRAQTTVVVGVGGELSALPFEAFSAPLFADMRNAGGELLGGYTIRVSWDPAVLSLVRVDAGTFAEPVTNSDSVWAGILKIGAVSASGGAGVLDLASLQFFVNEALSTPITVAATDVSAAGTLNDLTGIVTALSGTFCPALGRWGDLDGFNGANSRDALAILSAVVGLEVEEFFNLALGDVDGDGRVNTRDALIILSWTVGLEVPGQRVMLVVRGDCASQIVPSVAIAPDTVDIVIDQTVQLKVVGRNASGAPVALTPLHWETADPQIAFVASNGVIAGRDSGTTTVSARLGPGVVVRAPVTVRRQRFHWYVNSPAAKRATIQLGTQKYPFSTPQRAFDLVSEGDTIWIAPGIHDYEDGIYTTLRTGATIIGQRDPVTGARPVLRAPEFGYFTGFYWEGGRRGELKNLVLRGFRVAATLDGVRTFLMDSVRIEEPQKIPGYGVYQYHGMDTVWVKNSEFLSDTLRQSYYALYLGQRTRLARVDSSLFRHWGSVGIVGYDIDSLHVEDSEFDRNWRGVDLSGSDYRTPTVRAGLVHNRFLDHLYHAVIVFGAKRVHFRDNYFFQKTHDAINIRGVLPIVPGTKVTASGDSIRMRAEYYHGFYVDDMDSLLVDRLWYQLPPDTAMVAYNDFQVHYGRFTDSKFLNLYNEGFDFRGRRLDVQASEFRGCMTQCTWFSATAMFARAYVDSGPVVNVTNSTFWNLNQAFWAMNSGDSAGPMTFSGNTLDSIRYGFGVLSDSVLVSDNVFTAVREWAVNTQPSFSARPFRSVALLRNRTTCHPTAATSWGAIVQYTAVRTMGNWAKNCDHWILHRNSASYATVDAWIQRDTVTLDGGVTGFDGIILSEGPRGAVAISGNRVVGQFNTGINLMPSGTADSIALDSNVVSGAGTGVFINTGPIRVVTGLRNNLQGNTSYGVRNSSGGGRKFNLGRFVGNGVYGVYNTHADPFDATQNWWGDAAGVAGATADTVFGNVDPSNPLTTDPTDVPALGAPALVAVVTPPAATDPGTVAEPQAPADVQAYFREKAARTADAKEARAERDAMMERALREFEAALAEWKAKVAAKLKPPS